MAYEVVIPRLGLTMEEGSVVDWYKKDGEAVQVGEPMFSVETDKAVMDVEAPFSGLLYRLPELPEGMQPIGTLVGYILQPGEALPSGLGGEVEPAGCGGSVSASQPSHGVTCDLAFDCSASRRAQALQPSCPTAGGRAGR